MTNGILIFAHNNREIDYALMAVIAGGLARKHLNVPATLVTDASTLEWMAKSEIVEKAKEVFEAFIIVEKPLTDNQRRLHDGKFSDVLVPFVNANRASAWDLTPYDRTLLIDSDFLIFSDRLSEYWDVDESILVSDSMNDMVVPSRNGYHDNYISHTGVKLFWATTVMFTKDDVSKMFFETVDFVRTHYSYYGDLFRFDPRQYRNDISFSVANHLLYGFEEPVMSLPPVLTTIDKDILHSVDDNGKLTFLLSGKVDANYCPATIKDTDVHVMNKKSIVRNAENLMRLI